MSKASTSGSPPGQRAAAAVIVGILVFALVSLTTESDRGLAVGIVASILAWLLTAPRATEQKESGKKK